MGSLIPHFPWASNMAGELHDNVEAKAFTPAGAESSRLVVSNGEMAAFHGVQQRGGVSVADREQAMFGNGFDFNQASNIYGTKDTLAWDPRQTYGDIRQGGLRTDVVRMTVAPDVEHKIWPYRGQENARLTECTSQDPQAWEHAYSAFPNLRSHLSESQAVQLMKAIVHNELHCYSFEDAAQDKTAKHGHMGATSKETIGYPQISPRAISEFETGKTATGAKLHEPYPQLTDFFKSKGYVGDGYQSRVLEDPTCVPMIVAAKLESLCDYYNSHADKVSGGKIDITPQSLAYGFNADVFYNAHDKSNPGFHANPVPVVASQIEARLGNEKAFPTSDPRVLSASLHLQNISKAAESLGR